MSWSRDIGAEIAHEFALLESAGKIDEQGELRRRRAVFLVYESERVKTWYYAARRDPVKYAAMLARWRRRKRRPEVERMYRARQYAAVKADPARWAKRQARQRKSTAAYLQRQRAKKAEAQP